MSDVSRLYDSVLEGDAKTAVAVTKEALSEGIDPSVLVTEHMIPAMAEVGRRFECQQYYVPEVLLAARAMKGALELIRPALSAKGAKPAGRVVIGTVKGDLHDIGKNLVASMLEGAGFEVTDLGVDVSPARFLAELQSRNAEILALSALLTTTMPSMERTIEELTKAGLRQKVKVMIGGAPVTQQYADQIGADAYSDNANGAVRGRPPICGRMIPPRMRWFIARLCGGFLRSSSLPGDEFLNLPASDVIGVLHGRRLHEVGGRADERALEAVVQRQLAAADGIDHHAGRVRAVPDLDLDFEIQRHVAEGRPSIRMWHHLRSLSQGT